ncbi:hypothetical protein HAX54_014728 [Datura stramonium]|uniref:Uncharacterized protein n=1 Tax=Datura stramonium TaxID=4076 RepID=A0ABS8TQF7_DATST|nr:hypothetical protein [Datura stramonium]
MSLVEVFEETYKKRQKDSTRDGWIELRGEKTYAGFQRDVAGGIKKGRVYGVGVQSSSCCLSPLLSGASTSQCPGEIKVMRRQIEELKQRCDTFDVNFTEIQKFMKKHMPESEEEEETESDEVWLLWLFCLGRLDIFCEI